LRSRIRAIFPWLTAVSNTVTVDLALSATNEFDAPVQVSIPAGTTSVSFPVTNYDDALAGGTAVVTLTASAPGYGKATATLLNDDNEPGRLFVSLASSLPGEQRIRHRAGPDFPGATGTTRRPGLSQRQGADRSAVILRRPNSYQF